MSHSAYNHYGKLLGQRLTPAQDLTRILQSKLNKEIITRKVINEIIVTDMQALLLPFLFEWQHCWSPGGWGFGPERADSQVDVGAYESFAPYLRSAIQRWWKTFMNAARFRFFMENAYFFTCCCK